MKRCLFAGLMVFFFCFSCLGRVLAVEVSGVAPGNGGDALATTFHFNSSNANFQMTKPDGTPLTINDMPLAYGSSFQIFNDSQDWVAKQGLRVLGADLSGFTWTSANFPTPGTVAVDPASGRFKFAAPTWERMGFIDMPPGNAGAFAMPVVMHSDGSGVAAFSQIYNSPNRVFANHYVPGLGWQGPVIIDSVPATVAARNATNPQLAMDSEGRVMCVFRQNTWTSNYRVYANLYLPGAGWQGPVLIDSGQDFMAETTQVAMISGKAVCVFDQYDASGNYRVYANEYTPASGWYGAVTIDAGSAVDNMIPSLAINSSGRAFCVYTRQEATPRLHAVEYVSGAGWQTPVPIDDGTAASVVCTGLAMNNTGRVLCLIGAEKSGPLYAIQSVEYVPGTGWSAPLELYASSYGFVAGYLALNQAGLGLAAYNAYDGANARLYARQYTAGLGWSSPVLIDAGAGYDVYNRRLALNDQGQAICVFRQEDGTANRIYVNHFSNVAGWSGARVLDAGLGLNADYPNAAINANGEALCVWRQYDGSKNRMDSSRLQVEYPTGTVSVRYSYTPAASLPTVPALVISNRKLEPLKGGRTSIQLALVQAGMVSIKIYTLQGMQVKTLANEYLAAGNYTFDWAALNDGGSLVASGVYLIRVKSPGIDKTQKVVVIK